MAIWGPPGTGKTHFLAAAILGLAAAHATAGKSFRVLITAFTHAAIENLLRKIDELARRIPGLSGAVALAKVKKWQGETAAVGAGVTEDHMVAWLEEHQHAVAGATMYSCIKAEKKADLPEFDLVVVDEASQVRVAEASVPVSLVGPNGRLVFAGDDLQLPPIVQGAYPEVEPGDPVLHRSIFEAIRSRVSADSPVVRKLLENRRMTDVLTSFAAELLYGSDYRCFDETVAGRRLAFNKPRVLSELCAACLDPAYPMVVVVLEGVQAANENRVEAALVADLVDALREGLFDDSGKVYADDQRFFARGLFIVSPHRAQIRAIRRELNTRRGWTSAALRRHRGQDAGARGGRRHHQLRRLRSGVCADGIGVHLQRQPAERIDYASTVEEHRLPAAATARWIAPSSGLHGCVSGTGFHAEHRPRGRETGASSGVSDRRRGERSGAAW